MDSVLASKAWTLFLGAFFFFPPFSLSAVFHSQQGQELTVPQSTIPNFALGFLLIERRHKALFSRAPPWMANKNFRKLP